MVHMEQSKADPASNGQTSVRTSVMRRLARRGWAAVAALGMVLGLSVFNASPASAYVGTNTLRNWDTGFCLTLDGGWLHTDLCNSGNKYQIWEPVYVQHDAYDVVRLRNVGTGTCVNLEDTGYLGHRSCDNTTVRQWFEAQGTGWDKTRLYSRYWFQCLNNWGLNVTLQACNDTGNQKWKLGY